MHLFRHGGTPLCRHAGTALPGVQPMQTRLCERNPGANGMSRHSALVR